MSEGSVGLHATWECSRRISKLVTSTKTDDPGANHACVNGRVILRQSFDIGGEAGSLSSIPPSQWKQYDHSQCMSVLNGGSMTG